MTKTAERFIVIGIELVDEYELLYHTSEKLSVRQQTIAAIEAALIPDGGWPGSNETSRKAARDKTYSEHDELQALRQDVADLELRQSGHNLAIQGLNVEHRALEMAVHAQMLSNRFGDPLLAEYWVTLNNDKHAHGHDERTNRLEREHNAQLDAQEDEPAPF